MVDESVCLPRSEGREDVRAVLDREDFTLLSDAVLLSRRMEMRCELERLGPESSDYAGLTVLYDRSTKEIEARVSRGRS